MRIKELDAIIENIKHQSDQKCEKLNSKIEILHSRVAEAENYKRNADQLCQNAQVHSQEVFDNVCILKTKCHLKILVAKRDRQTST